MRWIREVYRSLRNLVRFFKIVWQWRWYDPSYAMDLVVKDLEIRLEHWGKDTHYVGDNFTKGRIMVLLRWYKRSKDSYRFDDELKYEKKFLQGYAKNIMKFWD